MEGGRTWPWGSRKKKVRKRELERQTAHCLKLYLPLKLSLPVTTCCCCQVTSVVSDSVRPPLSLGFSRQEYWSGLPFPSSMHESEKSKRVTQLCPTLSDPMDCSPPGSCVHGIFQARVLKWGANAFSSEFLKSLFFFSLAGENGYSISLYHSFLCPVQDS